MLRTAPILVTLTVAVFFIVAVINNTVDYHSSFAFTYHTLSMDMTKQNPHFMWRAITYPALQHAVFISIIVTQGLIALLCLLSVRKMIKAFYSNALPFQQAKTLAILGCSVGFVLYGLGFLTIAGQWFMMRETSGVWNVQASVQAFLILIGISLIFLSIKEN